MTAATLHLPRALADQILAAARTAYPDECCGLIEGVLDDTEERATAIHPARNTAEDTRRHFLIDPAQQFALLRRLRGTPHQIIGCFHSHPDGAAEPSATDRAMAIEDGFIWLLAAGNPERGFSLSAWRFDSAALRFVPLKLAGG